MNTSISSHMKLRDSRFKMSLKPVVGVGFSYSSQNSLFRIALYTILTSLVCLGLYPYCTEKRKLRYECFKIQIFLFIHRIVWEAEYVVLIYPVTPESIQCLAYFAQHFPGQLFAFLSTWSNFSGMHGRGARLAINFQLIITPAFRPTWSFFCVLSQSAFASFFGEHAIWKQCPYFHFKKYLSRAIVPRCSKHCGNCYPTSLLSSNTTSLTLCLAWS